MKSLVLALVFAVALGVAVAVSGVAAPPAEAHRSGCHSRHECPSDHASYRWGPKQLLCVAPYSPRRNATFRLRVAHDGRAYLCKR